jgi:Amt family ammonium transporter
MLVGPDTACMLTCAYLVLMMTMPGLALFCGGLLQAPNVLGTIMLSSSITCGITAQFTCRVTRREGGSI